jgi:phosphopantothenoylcysteine decarboxylase/phosphopantothenate--cysteine ligase
VSATSSPPTVVLGITGSIAAYKAVAVASKLVQRGVQVRAIMTRAATALSHP